MSLERNPWTPAEQSVVNTNSPENPHALYRRATKVGRHTLEFHGFKLLDEVASPHESIRRRLQRKVIDQDQAIDAIIDSLDRTNVRPAADKRPLASLAFLGPTGVGKSETAKTLANVLSGTDEGNLIKIDCSGFSHGHEIASLVGAPPSYVGREQKPILSKEQVEKPGTVVLFDEIEKGSPPLYNLMLQIMGDGQLKLNDGNTTSFRDSVIILTSNLGAKEMSRQLSTTAIGFGDCQRTTDRASLEQTARKSFTEFFTPEFINRLNRMVVFHPLGEQGLQRVLDVKLAEANSDYVKQFGVRVSLSDQARAALVSGALVESHLGARPLIRALENDIQSTFGRYTDSGMLPEGTQVHVVHHNELPESYTKRKTPFHFMVRSDATIRKQPVHRPLPAPIAAVPPDIEPDPFNVKM